MSRCACEGGLKLVFACSGAADVGELADRTARALSAEGTAKMFCLTGVGARLSGFIKSTEAAEEVLVIDGCAQECGRNCLEEAGLTGFKHLSAADEGFTKGRTEVSSDAVEHLLAAARNLFTGENAA